jgi:hypothetical protein
VNVRRSIRRTISARRPGLRFDSDMNADVAVNVGRHDSEGGRPMTDRPSERLTDEELDQQNAEALPERDQMSLVNLNLAVPVNAALAANVLSDGATAAGIADQSGAIDQGTL